MKTHTWSDLECWGMREHIEYILELEHKLSKIMGLIQNED